MSKQDRETTSPVIPGQCPVCGAPRVQAHRPFCSERCKTLDLHRWLSEAYVIPGPTVPEERPTDEEAD